VTTAGTHWCTASLFRLSAKPPGASYTNLGRADQNSAKQAKRHAPVSREILNRKQNPAVAIPPRDARPRDFAPGSVHCGGPSSFRRCSAGARDCPKRSARRSCATCHHSIGSSVTDKGSIQRLVHGRQDDKPGFARQGVEPSRNPVGAIGALNRRHVFEDEPMPRTRTLFGYDGALIGADNSCSIQRSFA
jgi:hypothetical protein